MLRIYITAALLDYCKLHYDVTACGAAGGPSFRSAQQGPRTSSLRCYTTAYYSTRLLHLEDEELEALSKTSDAPVRLFKKRKSYTSVLQLNYYIAYHYVLEY